MTGSEQLRKARAHAAFVRQAVAADPSGVVPLGQQYVLALDAALTERETTIESERSAFTTVYYLQVSRTAEVLAAVAAVRELHRSGWVMNLTTGDSDFVCGGCRYVAARAGDPCPTILALDGLDLSRPADVPLPWGDTASTPHQEQ